MNHEVRVGEYVARAVAETYGPERTSSGGGSEWDFWSGPLQAAEIGFRNFDSLSYDDVPAIRRLTVVDRVFGPVVFVGVLLNDGVVEIADFAIDPDYWSEFEDEDPDL